MSSTSRPPIVEEFLAEAATDRRTIIEAVDEVIRRRSPEIEVGRAGRMLGYGPFHYKYASGREGDTFVVSMMNGAQALSIYIAGGGADGMLVESNADRLGKVSTGRGCIKVKKLEHLDLTVLDEIVGQALAERAGT